MSKSKTKPTLDQCQFWAKSDVSAWRRRNDRFQREQDKFYLKQPRAAKPGEELVVPNDPAFITDKVGRILGGLRQKIDILPRDPANTERAQKIENLVRQLWKMWSRRHAGGIHPPLQHDMGKYLAQRGWVCSRVVLADDEESDLPVLHTLADAAGIYPYVVGDDIHRVTHVYKASVSDLLDDEALPKSEKALAEIADHSYKMQVYAQYAKYNGIWYHMVWTGGGGSGNGWLKEPTAIGYMPWVISIAAGSPWRGTEWDDDEYIEHIGESFFTSMMGMYEQHQKLMSMIATIIATMANPPTIYFGEDGARVDPNELSMKPGARLALPKGKIEQFRLGAGLSDIMAYYGMLSERQGRAGFTGPSYGDQRGLESGWMGEVLQGGNADVMSPYTEALKQHLDRVYDKALSIIGEFWPEQMDVFIEQGLNRSGEWAKLSPTDIKDEKPEVTVTFNSTSVIERMQLANMASMLKRENIISMATARGKDFVNIDDPYLEEQLVRADLVNLDPDFIKALIPIALLFTGMDLEGKLYGMLHGEEIVALLSSGYKRGTQQAAPVEQQVPAGVPGDVAPPAAMGATPTDPRLQRIVDIIRMMSGASGGLGGGGLPPVPGSII